MRFIYSVTFTRNLFTFCIFRARTINESTINEEEVEDAEDNTSISFETQSDPEVNKILLVIYHSNYQFKLRDKLNKILKGPQEDLIISITNQLKCK